MFLHCLEQFRCFFKKILGCFFLGGGEGLFRFLLVGRSSSSDCIGLFGFVMGIVPDCCESSRLFS